MFNLYTGLPHAPQVVAQYRDGCETFELPEGATLAELAGRLCDLDVYHEQAAVSVKLLFAAQYRPAIAATSSTSEWNA